MVASDCSFPVFVTDVVLPRQRFANILAQQVITFAVLGAVWLDKAIEHPVKIILFFSEFSALVRNMREVIRRKAWKIHMNDGYASTIPLAQEAMGSYG